MEAACFLVRNAQAIVDISRFLQRCPAAPPPTRRNRGQVSRNGNIPVPSSVPGIARLPDGWAHIDAIDVGAELNLRVNTLKAVLWCIRGSFCRIMTQVLLLKLSSRLMIQANSRE